MAQDLASLILHTLAQKGVRHIFGIPGDAINGLVDAVRRQDVIRFITVRHEEAGAFAASAQAKLTGGLGVVAGTAGPGAIHLLNGLYDAKMDGAPVLAITGQVETALMGSDYHQEVDLSKLFSDVAVFSETIVTPAQMPKLIHLAIRTAFDERGVAHLTIPSDLALAPVGPGDDELVLPGPPRLVPDEESLAGAAAAIDSASSITLLVGIGARSAVDEVLRLSEKLDAPIIKTLRAKELIPDRHPQVIGGLGLLGTSPAVDAMYRTDLLFMVGTDFPYQDFYPDQAAAIQLDIDPSQIGRRNPVEVALVGDAQATLSALLPMVAAVDRSDHMVAAREGMEDWLETMRKSESDDAVPIRPQRVAAEVGAEAGPGTIYVVDTGAVTAWAARHVAMQEGDRFTLSSSLASMAFGLPGAIGAQLAFPDRRVVALVGDGGFSMLIGELLTAVDLELPLTVVVFNNSKLGLIQMEQEAEGLPEYATGLANPDFAEVARAMGADGRRVEDPADLRPALADAFSSPRPTVVDVVINPEEVTMPPSIELKFVVGYAKAKMLELAGKGEGGGLASLKSAARQAIERI